MRDERLTALDGIAVFFTGVLAASLLAFPWVVAPSFRAMFADFGAREALLPLTRLVLSAWFPCLLGGVVAGGPVLACIPSVPLGYRRRVLVGAFVVGCACVALCVVGVYLPIFALADAIKA